MKKIITAFSLIAMAGLSFIGYKNTNVDGLLETETKYENTYIVSVDGDVTGSEEDKALAEKNRKKVLSELAYKLGEDSYEVTYVYDTVFNGFAIKTSAFNAELLKESAKVSEVSVEHKYSQPDGSEKPLALNGESASKSIKQMKLENYSAETMAARASDIKAVTGSDSHEGEGITVGILDTGLYLNQVEGTTERTAAEANTAVSAYLNKPAFKALASGVETPLTAETIAAKNVTTKYTYINNKIPFAYDYADNDNNVNPKSEEHGTHVASLAAANGEDFQGIAPKAQVGVFKVFGDDAAGAGDAAIIAAINDATKLGLDEINMSLGSDLTDEDDVVSDASYIALKNAMNAGVIANISAGNAGKNSFSSGDYADFTTDTVETGILGSYANYDETANIVASSNPDKAFYSSIMNVTADGATSSSAVSYSDQVVTSKTQNFTRDRYLTDLLGYEKIVVNEYDEDTTYYSLNEKGTYTKLTKDQVELGKEYYVQNSTVEKEYIVIPGYGTEADYETLEAAGKSVEGKVAVIHRGNTTFVDKVNKATSHKAIAAIVINNTPSTTFNFSMDFNDNSPDIPVVFVFQNSTSAWGSAGTTGKINLFKNTVSEAGEGNTVSSFSSDGPSTNLDLGPTVSAPGYQVIGAVNAVADNAITSDTSTTGISGLYGYENLSGTSMAAPNLTGALALALGEKKAEFNDETKFANEKKVISMKAMASADQLLDGGKTSENSPRLQGAGRINVEKLLTANSYITSTNSDTGGFDNASQAKVELKNSGDLYVADGDFSKDTDEDYIEFEYTVHNDDTVSKTYTPSISVMIPELEVQVTHDAYAAEEETSRSQEVGYDSSVTFVESDLDTYPTFVGTPTMSIRDDTVADYVSMSDGGTKSLTVAAGATATGTAKIRIDNLTFTKNWGDSKVTNFEGTLRDYIAKYFASAGGTYVEGFLKLEETSDNEGLETLTMPYMGFYGDYTIGEAVEPFNFEKEEAIVDGKYNSKYHIYNSDLINTYMKGLNSTYAKPNAYAGSALSATGAALSDTQISSIANFNSSPVPNGSDLLSVTGSDNSTLYAGSDSSKFLNAFFFVNRSCSSATWSINQGSTVKASGNVNALFVSSGAVTQTTSYGLIKSWLTSSTTGYDMDRGYASIPVSSIAEGEYTLNFSFTLRGAKDSTGANKVQTKSYKLIIDKTAPQYISATTEVNANTNRTRLTVRSKGANDAITVGSTGALPELVSGTSDVYEGSAYISNSDIKANKVAVTLTDYAHNATVVLIHPSDLTFSVASTFFTNKYEFTIALVNSSASSYYYTVEFTDKNDNVIESLSGSYYIYVQLSTGLSADDIQVKIDSEEVAASNYSYDATTGILEIKMPKDAASFELNYRAGGNSSDDSSNTSSSDNSGTSSEEKKSGCNSSVIAATSSVAALGLLSIGLLLKKKKEDK